MRAIIATLLLAHTTTLPAAESPYAGDQDRAIKALSPAAIQGYREGQGMGYAMAAELNHYPGPKHVLELAAELDLSPEQRKESQALFEAMNAEAARLGEQLVELEQQLDQHFAETTITPDTLRDLTNQIATLEGHIRYTHLEAHLSQRGLLTDHQIRQYDQLRGYGGQHRHGSH